MKVYPGFLTPSSKPFDPVELARITERLVCRNLYRKYTDFYATGVYGGIVTGYTCGCCLRCSFCWVDWSRDFPEKYGRFYSPEESFRMLSKAADNYGTNRLRLSGAEPTLCKDHLLSILDLVERSKYKLFILETNGIIFGVDEDYVRKISEFKKAHVRVSLKAGTPKDFTRKTGAKGESFELPFKGIKNLMKHSCSFHVAAMSADPRIMISSERNALLGKLAEIDKNLLTSLEEEVIDPYQTTLKRLKYAECKIEWPLKKIYKPIKL
ncbi:MAG: radical SAM protein [Thermoplasmatales archaeon]|nr:MAG: radical SAM protein [Thermoplasmatales archaeon]